MAAIDEVVAERPVEIFLLQLGNGIQSLVHDIEEFSERVQVPFEVHIWVVLNIPQEGFELGLGELRVSSTQRIIRFMYGIGDVGAQTGDIGRNTATGRIVGDWRLMGMGVGLGGSNGCEDHLLHETAGLRVRIAKDGHCAGAARVIGLVGVVATTAILEAYDVNLGGLERTREDRANVRKA